MPRPYGNGEPLHRCGTGRWGVRPADHDALHLPQRFPLIILGSTLRLGAIVLIEASLSFLGFGIPAPFPSWGQMLSTDGRDYMRIQPILAVFPGIAIGILVFSYNLFGDAMRDVLDPRLRGTR